MMKLNAIFQLLFLGSAILCHACPRGETKLNQGSITDLAEKAGFASRLSKDTEVYISYQGLDKLVRSMIDSKIGKAIDELDPENNGLKQAILEDRDYEDFMIVAAEDLFVSGGKGSSQLLEGFGRFSSGMIQYQMRRDFLQMVARMKGEEEWWRAGGDRAPRFILDGERGLKMLKELEISPAYGGFKVSDKEKRDELVKKIQEGLNSPVKFQPKEKNMRYIYAAKSEVEGGFSGFRWNGASFVKVFRDERGDERLKKQIGAEVYEEGLNELAKHEFVLMAGVVGDYIVFYAGKNTTDIAFASSVEESLLANPELNFARNYADRDLKGLVFFSNAAMKNIQGLRSELPMIAKAFSEVLDASEYFGDTREIQDLINIVGERSEFLFDLLHKTRWGVAMYLEDGFKIDSYLGKDASIFDLDTKRKLATMASHDGAMLSGSWILKSEFSENWAKLLETAMSTTYKIFQLAVEQDVHDDDWLEFATNFRVADSEFSDDLVRFWKSMQSGLVGLSNEHAIMLDLKGRMPSAIPDIPKLLKEQGVIPRFSYASTVTDRAKLASGWDAISAAAKDLGNGVGKLVKEDVKMLMPVMTTEAGIDLWTYKVEYWDHDFQPTLGLNDKLFFLSTSPSYIRELAQKKAAALSPGAELVMRLDPVRDAASHWLKVIDEHVKEFMSERDKEEFNTMIPQIKKFIEVSKEVEKLDIYTRKIDGEIRNTIHFHTK